MNMRNTKRRMSVTNTSKENLQYNEKERDTTNIVFEPRQLFDPRQNFMDLRHPRQNLTHAILFFFFFDPRRNFINPCHSRHPRQNLTDESRDPGYLTHYFLL